MDAHTIFNLILRIVIWLLLTNDISIINIAIGVAIALLIPRNKVSAAKLKDWLQIIWEIVKAIPIAYIEAIQIMLRPHNDEDFIYKRVKPRRTSGLIFLDIFLITFTPKTIVSKYDEAGLYEIHLVKRAKNKK